MHYQSTHFLFSAPNINSMPLDIGIEVAFAGISNTGKSSAINALTNNKKLARTSKLPGCTRLINLFEVVKGKRLIDLPGYGYAAAPKKIKCEWQGILKEYLKKRQSLKGLIILMDIRYPLKLLDKKIILWAIENNIDVLVLLTKADKLPSNIQILQLNMVHKKLLNFSGKIQVELFSSFKKLGVDKLHQKLNTWFNK